MPHDLTALVTDLRTRLEATGLGPADQVRALAALLTEIGWRLAQPGCSGDRRALESALALRGDLASALILQGAVLLEWIGERPSLLAESTVDNGSQPCNSPGGDSATPTAP